MQVIRIKIQDLFDFDGTAVSPDPISVDSILTRLSRIITFLILCSTVAFGQGLKSIEQELIVPLSRISTVFNGAYYDTLDKDNETFQKMLVKYLSTVPSTMVYPFSKLKKEGLSIATSADNKFRIYSWDTRTGGSMHIFSNLYQYKVGDKIFEQTPPDRGDESGFFSEIFTVDSFKQIYLGLSNSIYSAKDCGNTVRAFKIEENRLNDSLFLFKVDTGEASREFNWMPEFHVFRNEISFGFNFFSVVDRPERPVKIVHYDENTKTLKLPVLGDNDDVTDKFILYRYNGKYFEVVKE